MIVLPFGASPDGFVRVTTCPARVCLPVTLNPRLSSTWVALAKRRPTTSGTAITGGVLAVARRVGLAVGVPFGEAERELAGDGARELAGEGELRPAGTTAAAPDGTAAAALDLDADAEAAGVLAAAAWVAG